MRPDCTHLDDLIDFKSLNIEKIKKNTKCLECASSGPNLWLCLFKNCLIVGCGEAHKDHSTLHHKCHPSHCVHLNLSTLRLWCYKCESEVFQTNKLIGMNDKNSKTSESTDEEEDDDCVIGLTGLQNMGNTCYMNSALQALSNTPPLTNFFLECESTIFTKLADSKPGLSRAYFRFIQDMWNKCKMSYVVPSGILYAIRNVHPMFRGYQQHDTQEFLRCFMDQLHEELKDPVQDNSHSLKKALARQEESQNSLTSASFEELTEEDDEDGVERQTGTDNGSGDNETANASSQSEGEEYETCDSGVSERSSLSDEGERASKRRCSRSSSPQTDIIRSRLSNKPRSIARKKPPVKYRSIISDVFDGKVLSSVQCLTCERVSTRIETFQDLSLPIPSRDHLNMLHQGSITPQKLGLASCSDVHPGDQGWFNWFWHWIRSWFWGPTVSLHDCLAAFFSADELKGDNMYSCEKCNKLRNGVKYSKVLELPEVLCIHLKRFRHELMFSAKIGNFVSFPLEGLDMRPYLHKDCVSQVTTYDLMSVICHHGTAGGGHYTCYSLNYLNNKWFEFDDQYVTNVSPETVQNCEAYVLFYKKSSAFSSKQRQRSWELLESSSSSPLEPPIMQFYISKQWISKLNTFAEPGPIDNSDFICQHGGIHPSRVQIMNELYIIISQNVWEYLYETYGGGPACNHIVVCTTCQEEQEALQERINQEMEVFKKLTQDFKSEEHPSVIFVIAMNWFRQWQSFVNGKETDPPDPIDNSSIVIMKNGQPILKQGSDYAQFSEELWNFFHHVYGGGPELMLRSASKTPSNSPISTTPPAESTSHSWMAGWEQREPLTHTHKPRSIDSIYLNRNNSTTSNPSTSRPVRTKRVNSFNFNVNNIARRRKMRDMGENQLASGVGGGEPNITSSTSLNEHLKSEVLKNNLQNESGEDSFEEDESLIPIFVDKGKI